jgi:hypothetical protein
MIGEYGKYKGMTVSFRNVVIHDGGWPDRKKIGMHAPQTAMSTTNIGVSQLRRAINARLWNIVKA